MYAMMYERYGGPEVLQYTTTAIPTVGPHDVLIKSIASSLNAVDYRLMRANPFIARLGNGLLRPRKTRCLGADVAGIVQAVGAEVQHIKVGDHVFGEMSSHHLGGLAEYALARQDLITLKPDNLSFEEAAAAPLAGITAIQALQHKARIQPNETVLIHGAGGGVGSFAVQIARAMGATVTALCGPSNMKLMSELGAHEVIDYTRERFTEQPRRYDVILGINGYTRLSEYKNCLRPNGRYVMVGGHNKQIFDALFFGAITFAFSDKSCRILTLDDTYRAHDLNTLQHMLSRGDVRPIIDRRFPLKETAEAMSYVERGHVRGKVVIQIS